MASKAVKASESLYEQDSYAWATPRLRQLLGADLERIYGRARRNVEASLRDFGEDEAADTVPAACPYTLEQVLGDWLP